MSNALDTNDDSIRNATCFPYPYKPSYVVRSLPVVYYVHLILFIVSIVYLVVSTAKYFHYRKMYVRLRKRPVIVTLALLLGVTIQITVSLLQPMMDFPSIYLHFPRVFVIPLLGFSFAIRLVDYYNRFILAQTLLEVAQAGEHSAQEHSHAAEGEDEGSMARSAALHAVWALLKKGKVNDKKSKKKMLNQIANDETRVSVSTRDLRSVSVDTSDSAQAGIDRKKRDMVMKRAVVLLKFLSSNTLYVFVFVLLSLPFFINTVVIAIDVPCYNVKYYCYSCPRSSVTISIIVAVVIVIASLGFGYLVRKFPDPFGIVKEVKQLSLFAALPGIIVFSINSRFEDGFSPYFSIGWLMTFFMLCFQFISTDLQVYIAKHDKTEKANHKHKVANEDVGSRVESRPNFSSADVGNGIPATDALETLLSDPQEVALFEKHLVSELAVETITMYRDCAKFIRQYYDMNDNTRRARARRIIQQHVDDDALMQVNLPYQIRMDLLKKVNEPKPIAITLFDDAQKEVFGMLLGSYLRYTNSDAYKLSHPTSA